VTLLVAFAFLALNSHKNRGIKQSPPAEPHAGGSHTYDGVLPGAPKGSSVALLSPPQCHAAFGTMPHLGFSDPQPRSAFQDNVPLPDEDAYGWILKGRLYLLYSIRY
jgi:hypothetical protein